MITDITLVFFAAAVAVAIFAVITFAVALSYHKALKEKARLEVELNKLKTSGSEEANAILGKAQSDAMDVLRNAQIKAQEIIKTGEVFSAEYKQKFQAELLSLVAFEKKLYEDLGASVRQEGSKMINSMSQNINSQIKEEIDAFHKAMQTETAKVQNSMNESLSQAYKKAEQEVEEYRKQMLMRVNSVAFKIVEDTAKKALGESLSRQQHEKAIIKALEEAKKQNVF